MHAKYYKAGHLVEFNNTKNILYTTIIDYKFTKYVLELYFNNKVKINSAQVEHR